jgi:hypothetical protein
VLLDAAPQRGVSATDQDERTTTTLLANRRSFAPVRVRRLACLRQADRVEHSADSASSAFPLVVSG